MKVKRKCDYCGKIYLAETRDLKRGWGKCCNKKCAAKLRESKKSTYDPKKVALNNIRRENWVENGKDIWARKRGYPNFNAYQNDYDNVDSMSVTVGRCKYCGLLYCYCQCGEGVE